MAEIIRMPRLSDTMEEGNIVGWLKKVGDKVSPGDILAEVETDKATMELESFHEGYLLYISVRKALFPSMISWQSSVEKMKITKLSLPEKRKVRHK